MTMLEQAVDCLCQKRYGWPETDFNLLVDRWLEACLEPA
jgi:hypothetical protein